MQSPQADYFAGYRHLRLSRDDKGVLVAQPDGTVLLALPRLSIHKNAGSTVNGGQSK